MTSVRLFSTVLVLMVFGALTAPGTAQDRPYSVSLTGSYTTSSKIFYRPADPDEFLRGQFFPLDNIAGIGIDLRRTFPPGTIQIGLSAEILQRRTTSEIPVGGVQVPAEDGFIAIPVELTGYFFIPVGTEEFRVFMGGGAGLYLGQRRYALGGIPAETTERGAGGGIHVTSGVEWRCSGALSVRGEIKFRDVQFETTNRFQPSTVVYSGTTVTLPGEPFASRINIDGMRLSAGIAVHF
jgi:hypothetical protein